MSILDRVFKKVEDELEEKVTNVLAGKVRYKKDLEISIAVTNSEIDAIVKAFEEKDSVKLRDLVEYRNVPTGRPNNTYLGSF